MIIGEVIKKYRLKAQLTQQELADKTGLSKSFISHIEREDKIPHLDNLKKLSKALDVPMSIIMLEAADIPEMDKQLPTARNSNEYINDVVIHIANIINDLKEQYELRKKAKARQRTTYSLDLIKKKSHKKHAPKLSKKLKKYKNSKIDKLNQSETKN